MKRQLILNSTLAALLLLAPVAGAEESSEAADSEEREAADEETTGEIEDEATEEAMEEVAEESERAAAEDLERARQRRDGAEAAPAAREAEAREDESPRERRLRTREEIRAERERIKLERLREQERIRAQRLSERERIRAERAAERERIREERRAERERRRLERDLLREERRVEKERRKAERLAAREAYWSKHTRPRFYINGMLVGGALFEDSGNRWTGRESETLESMGGVFRAGGVIHDQHLLGARMQLMVRPSQSVLGEGATEDSWGLVGNLFVGPEYRYITSFGLYFGASVGLAATWAEADLERPEECRRWDDDCDDRFDDDEYDGRSAMSAGAIGMLGYELRISRWFAMNVEAFGGYYHGLDQDEQTVNNAVFGLAVGLGI